MENMGLSRGQLCVITNKFSKYNGQYVNFLNCSKVAPNEYIYYFKTLLNGKKIKMFSIDDFISMPTKDDVKAMIDLALSIGDKEWFEELHKTLNTTYGQLLVDIKTPKKENVDDVFDGMEVVFVFDDSKAGKKFDIEFPKIKKNNRFQRKEIVDIRKRLKRGEKISDIAKHYGVDPKTIRNIRDGKTYKDV